jgi:hypothetical protein
MLMARQSQTPHHFCPVQAFVRRVASVMEVNVPMATPLSFARPGSHMSAIHVTALVRQAAITTNLMAQGYDMLRIGTHLLRASGAMALKLQGAVDSTIMEIGRWSGTTYLKYIHSQIGTLNAGLAARCTQGGPNLFRKRRCGGAVISPPIFDQKVGRTTSNNTRRASKVNPSNGYSCLGYSCLEVPRGSLGWSHPNKFHYAR